MTDSANEDSVTRLNTQLNKSMVLMENAVDTPPLNNKRKSITINTEAHSSKTANNRVEVSKSRKSILKTSRKSDDNVTSDEVTPNDNDDKLERMLNGLPSSVSVLSRPRTLEEIVQKETLNEENISSTFNLEDISDSEELWIMDVPRLIDPQELHGQTIIFEDKSKFRIKDERYCIVAHSTSHTNRNVTCVFNSKKDSLRYKTVNIKPTGFLTVRRKLSRAPKVKPVIIENPGVQFPDNLRTRHPLFGVIHERKKRSKKRNSLKAC